MTKHTGEKVVPRRPHMRRSIVAGTAFHRG
jgi:hypothetical protein